jgi:hypothetical protein
MFITEQCNVEVSNSYFEVCIREMDRYATQRWPWRFALDFVRAFGSH